MFLTSRLTAVGYNQSIEKPSGQPSKCVLSLCRLRSRGRYSGNASGIPTSKHTKHAMSECRIGCMNGPTSTDTTMLTRKARHFTSRTAWQEYCC